MKQMFRVVVPVVLAGLIITGCGGGASENKPISEVKTEAQKMSVSQLKSIIIKYKKAIESKKNEMIPLKEKLQAIPLTQMFGEEAKKIKSDIDVIKTAIRALTERLNIYSQGLKSKL